MQLFIGRPLPSLEDLVEDAADGNAYVNGNKLKRMYKDLQPSTQENQRKIDIQNEPYEISIQQSTQGPSSEIIFNIKCIRESEELLKIQSLLQKCYNAVEDNLKEYTELLLKVSEMGLIIRTVIKALSDVEKQRPFGNAQLSYEDCKNMIFQLQGATAVHLMNCKKISGRREELLTFYKSLKQMLNLTHGLKEFHYNAFFKAIESDELFPILEDKREDMNSCNSTFFKVKGTLIDELQLLDQEVLHTLAQKDIAADYKSLRNVSGYLKSEISQRIDKIMTPKNIYPGKEQFQNIIVSFDNVPCFYCLFWPDIALEWVSRKRYWPSPETIKAIKKSGCYIVAKEKANQGNRLDWRWSFSSAEIRIAKARTPAMKYCYFLFKSLFYKYLKFKIDGKSLPSYLAKTCMLYVSEAHSAEWWNNAEQCDPLCLIELLKYLENKLKEKFLPHYFIKELNLIADISKEMRVKALTIITNIISNPIVYIRFEEHGIRNMTYLHSDIIGHASIDTKTVVRDDTEAQSQTISHAVTTSERPRDNEEVKTVNILQQHIHDEFNANHQQQDFKNMKGLNNIPKGIQKINYIIMIYKKIFKNRINLYRVKANWNYHRYSSRIYMYKKLISVQEQGLLRWDKKNEPLVKELLKQNYQGLEKASEGFKRLSRVYQNGLVDLNHLLKSSCYRCDLCQESIPCQNYRYCCPESCDFDVCVKCKLDKNIMKEDPNQNKCCHSLNYSNKCSKRCPAQLEVPLFGDGITGVQDSDKFLAENELLANEAFDLQNQLKLNVGSNCSKMMESGEIMSQLIAEVFESSTSNHLNFDTETNKTPNDLKDDRQNKSSGIDYFAALPQNSPLSIQTLSIQTFGNN